MQSKYTIKHKNHFIAATHRIEDKYVNAFLNIGNCAWTGYKKIFNLSLPEKIYLIADCSSENKVKLSTDGKDTIYLRVKSYRNLLPPEKSGLFHIFGLSHELAHIAMSRQFPSNFSFNDKTANLIYQAWADYAAAVRIVPFIYKKLGKFIWPGRYDYFASEGPEYFSRYLSSDKNVELVPLKKIAHLFFDLDQRYNPAVTGRIIKNFSAELLTSPQSFIERLSRLLKEKK